jgi:RNA polymerase sigma-70 factor (ECF subfamily)
VKGVDEVMANSLLRTDREIAEIYERHIKTVYRVCFAYMKNAVDTEDVAQETFCKLITSGAVFENGEHEKAWLIRTASNLCKNILRNWWRKRENLEDYDNLQDNGSFEIDDTFGVVMSLPDKYKTVIYLYYYEGYDSVEISKILHKPQSTIRNYLHEARKVLKNELGGAFGEE